MASKHRASKVWRTGIRGTVYLLHLSDGRHYIGSTEREIDIRIGEHCAGNGGIFTKWAADHGIQMRFARPWPGVDTGLEFLLKCWSGARRFCPICSGEKAHTRAVYDDWKIDVQF